jgi:mono/diheme cytochrome c family protein
MREADGIVKAAFLLAAVGTCWAQQPRQAALAHGETVYRVYCAVCHGDSGRGNGPMSTILKVPVPDLTALTARNSGTFPQQRVQKQLEADDSGTPGHGTRSMPIFGPAFIETGPNANDARVRIRDLIEYLKSIQVGRPGTKQKRTAPR